MNRFLIFAILLSSIAATAQEKKATPPDHADLYFRSILEKEYYPKAPDSLYHLEWSQLNERLDPYTEWTDEKESKQRKDMLLGSKITGVAGMRLFQQNDSTIVVTKVWKGGSAYKMGVGIGDTVISVAGVKAKEVKETSSMIKGEVGTKVEILFARSGKRFTKTLTRGKVEVENVMVKRTSKTMKIKVFMFADGITDSIISKSYELGCNNLDTVILDLRNNPGGLFDEGKRLAELFVKKGDTILTEKSRTSESATISNRFHRFQYVPNIIVLIDSGSASSSEIVAGALKIRRSAKMIGTNSFGKGLIQRRMDFDNGSFTYTRGEYFPGGVMKIQGKGIPVDDTLKAEASLKQIDAELDLSKFRQENPFPDLKSLKKANLDIKNAEWIWGDIAVFELQ